MEQWIKARGRFLVEQKNGRIAVQLGLDFVNYYNWFIQQKFKASFQIPRHSGHITVAVKTHNKLINFAAARKHSGEVVEFEYNPNLMIGGKRKGFTNFWMRARSERIEEIKKELKIIEGDRYQGLHITISQGGKNGAPVGKFQRKMIVIK